MCNVGYGLYIIIIYSGGGNIVYHYHYCYYCIFVVVPMHYWPQCARAKPLILHYLVARHNIVNHVIVIINNE